MKILFYSDSKEKGGAERYLELIMSGLKEKGHKISIAHNVRELKDLLPEIKPDILHFNMPDAYACGDAIDAAFSIGNVKIIATIHSLSRSPALKTGGGFKRWISLYLPFWENIDTLRGKVVFEIKKNKIARRLLRIARLIAVSEASKNEFVRMFGLKPQNLSVVYNGVAPKNYPENMEARKYLGLNRNEFLVACLGRLVKNKGQDVFIKAAAAVKNKVQNIKFLITGDGYLKEYLKRMSERSGLTQEVLFLDHEKTPWVFGAMDVSVVPSLSETFSFAVAESMLAGKPVVASAVGGIPELIVNDETGILVKPNDPHELAENIVKLANNKKLAGSMGQAGRTRVLNNFNIRNMIDRTEEVFKGK